MTLKIATDCSGIEAPIQALKDLKINFRHIWSCEKDKYCLETIKANYNPEIIYDDMLLRDNNSLPDIDCYVCGFPCQPFSAIGLKNNLNDKRSIIMFYCVDVIKKKLPKFFILENVPYFKSLNNSIQYNLLIKELKNIKKYNIYVDTLNALNYASAQRRQRLFFIGIKKDIQIKQYETPKHLKEVNIDKFLIDKTIYKNNKIPRLIENKIKYYNLNKKENYILDVTNVNYGSRSLNVCPTLSTSIEIYLLKYNRFLSTDERFLLQGFPKNFKKVVSNTQLKKQIGNAICVNVIRELFKEIFKCIKL